MLNCWCKQMDHWSAWSSRNSLRQWNLPTSSWVPWALSYGSSTGSSSNSFC